MSTDDLQAEMYARRKLAANQLARAENSTTMAGQQMHATVALVHAQLATSCATEFAARQA